jgi:cysteine desulfurase
MPTDAPQSFQLYLDHAATAPVLPEAMEAFHKAAENAYANPGSLHGLGAAAARVLDQSRKKLSKALGARNYRLIWTGTGTEGNHLGILGMAARVRKSSRLKAAAEANSFGQPRVLVSAIEHPSALQAAQSLKGKGFHVELIPSDSQGVIQPEALRPMLGEDVALVVVHWANNELGSLSPISELVALTRQLAPHASFHCDAVQAAGKRPESLYSLGADTISVAAHKMGGVRGCAALFLKDGVLDPIPMFVGGGHEYGLRSGTENVMGAAAFAAAADVRRQRLNEDSDRYLKRHQTLLTHLREIVPGLVVAGPTDPEHVLGSILSVAIPGTRAETLLHQLEARGISCGSGSACSAHGHTESAILTAIDFPKEHRNSVLRFSFDGSEATSDLKFSLGL